MLRHTYMVASTDLDHCAGPGALLLLAPPCSSWTRVSRGTTMRTKLNPLGLDYQFVKEGNLTIARWLGILWCEILALHTCRPHRMVNIRMHIDRYTPSPKKDGKPFGGWRMINGTHMVEASESYIYLYMIWSDPNHWIFTYCEWIAAITQV